MNESDQPSAPEICQLVADLYEAQIAANDGWSDFFELKKAVLRRMWGVELREDFILEMLPKKLRRELDKIICLSLFRHYIAGAWARHPECKNFDELETAIRAEPRYKKIMRRGRRSAATMALWNYIKHLF